MSIKGYDENFIFLGGLHGEVLNGCLRCGCVVFSVEIHKKVCSD